MSLYKLYFKQITSREWGRLIPTYMLDAFLLILLVGLFGVAGLVQKQEGQVQTATEATQPAAARQWRRGQWWRSWGWHRKNCS